jgi:nickel superoxide dismutase
MSLLDHLLYSLDRLIPPRVARAHCDIPCGIYDPHNAQIAALTVIRMFQMIDQLPKPEPGAGKQQLDDYNQSLARCVAVKEEHASLCEHELTILWTDYFKPEHLENHPDLHDLVWKTTKLCSTVKQEMDMQAAQQLLAGVQQIAEIFWSTKDVQTRRQPSKQPAGGEIVYPVAA